MKTRYWLILLLLVTATVTTNFYHLAMACLSTFVLAYLTKGSRKHHPDKS